MEEVKALMMDGSLDRETREKRTAEVNARYSKKMEETKEAADVRLADEDASALAKVRAGAGAAAIPLRLYGRASGAAATGTRDLRHLLLQVFRRLHRHLHHHQDGALRLLPEHLRLSDPSVEARGREERREERRAQSNHTTRTFVYVVRLRRLTSPHVASRRLPSHVFLHAARRG